MSMDWSQPDWQREAPRRLWDPSRQLLQSIRTYQSPGSGLVGSLRRKMAVLRHRFWSVVSQAEIDLTTQIDGGLLIPHPNGIVIHPQAQIGANCLIFQQVTLGTVSGRRGAPRLGIHVDIGAGARILGPVNIGDHTVIGANAVVLTDVPPHATAVGVPARIIKRKESQ